MVLNLGPHRAGKATLAKRMSEVRRTYYTLDDQIVHEASWSESAGFFRGLDRADVDEIQHARPAPDDQEDGR